MGVLQAIIATAGSTGGGGGGPPPYVGTDFFYSGDQNNWLAFGGLQSGSIFSNPPPANPSYTYPDGSYTGKTLDFTGTEWMISTNLGFGGAWVPNGSSITINLWFYPTANNVQILSEMDVQDNNMTNYHYTVLELNSTGNVKARFWNGAGTQGITSNNTVILNRWNHIRFAEDTQGGHYLEVNGIPTNSQTYYTRSSPGPAQEYFAIGVTDPTNMGATSPFQGKIGYLQISDYLAPSLYSANLTRFNTINTGSTLGANWTIEIIAELLPTTFWATLWGNETYNNGFDGLGHFAYFQNTSSLNVGSPAGMDAYNVTGIEVKGYWAFTHQDGGPVKLYRNGVLVNPNASGYVEVADSPNTLLIGARHQNYGGGATDGLPGNYYYYNVNTSTALDATAIQASYNSLKTTYGLP